MQVREEEGVNLLFFKRPVTTGSHVLGDWSSISKWFQSWSYDGDGKRGCRVLWSILHMSVREVVEYDGSDKKLEKYLSNCYV